LYFIVGNSPVTWIPRLVGTRTLLNVDGLDWKRSKWPPLAKGYIRLSERLATVLPDGFITDSLVVQDYYRERFNRVPPSIPYGSDVEIIPPGETLERFGLRSREYVLFVGRLVPENCAHDLVSAYRHLETQMKCVIVGDAPYAESYKENLKAIAAQDPRVLLTGYVFGRGYHELGSNAYLFVEPSGVGGTHPALVEAMAFGNCVVVNGTPENRETIGDAGLAYDSETGPDGLHEVLARLIRDQRAVEEFQEKARERARTFYSWDKITQDYEQLFLRAIGRVDIDEGLGCRSRDG
jgi:glycosyltransferase involved in cell wall biosynthesis